MSIIGAMSGLKGNNYYFEHNNRNKRSLVLDMKNIKGKEIFLKLIDSADVFLNNMSIEAPIDLGIGPDDLLARNPRLIYAQASGWGRKDLMPSSFHLNTQDSQKCLMMCAGERLLLLR